MKLFNLFIAVAALTLVGFADFEQDEPERPYVVKIGSVSFEPAADSFEASADSRRFIIQFEDIPGEEERARLAAQGIELGRYISGYAYYARSVSGKAFAPSQVSRNIRATRAITREMKLDPSFKASSELKRKIRETSDFSYIIAFFDDVSREESDSLLEDIPHETIVDNRGVANYVEISTGWEQIESLLDEDAVRRIEPGTPPKKEFDKLSQQRTNADQVIRTRSFRHVNGAPIQVGVWESARISPHTDLAGRVSFGDSASGTSSHALAVASLIGGSGVIERNGMGQAPDVGLVSYDWNNLMPEITAAAGNNVYISNHSWGYVAGWDTDDSGDETIYTWGFDWLFQYYGTDNAELDDTIREYDLLFVKSAGNDRNEGHIGPWKFSASDNEFNNDLRPSDPDYGSISGLATTKNSLVVGALSRDNAMTGFSSWGPTLDGRVKPDVVAPGRLLYTAAPNNSYDSFSGTSASAPVVTGTAALLGHYYKKRHNSDAMGLLLKGLLIHGAADLGRPGPDYEFGYGLVDAEFSAKVIRKAVMDPDEWPGDSFKPKDRDDSTYALILDDSIEHKKVKRFRLNLDQDFEVLRATLVWHDPGNENLVNDIHVQLKPPKGTRKNPWRLDGGDPDADAVQKRNFVDNVERVDVENPVQGEWRVIVKGARIAEGPQRYVLIISAGDDNREDGIDRDTPDIGRVICFTSTNSSFGDAEPEGSFEDGDVFYLYSYVEVLANSRYDDYDAFGTISGIWKVTNNATGETIYQTSTAFELEQNEEGYAWIIRLAALEIPSGMPRGGYTLEVTMSVENGDSATDTYVFNVQ